METTNSNPNTIGTTKGNTLMKESLDKKIKKQISKPCENIKIKNGKDNPFEKYSNNGGKITKL